MSFGPAYFTDVPKYGVGLGVNPSDVHVDYLARSGSLVDFFEVTAAAVRHVGPLNYLDVWQRRTLPKGFVYRTVPEMAAEHRVLVHSTNVNPVYPDPVQNEDLTNLKQLITASNTPWITEDLGIWLMSERHVYPYFMQFPLDEAALTVAIDNIHRVQDQLGVPFNAEFPPMSVVMGDMHAFDFFRRLVTETGCGMCLDVGHVLSYQIARGASPSADFHLLPWDHVTEIHVAGGGLDLNLQGYRYNDDHGDLPIISVCLDMVDTVVRHAPHLRAITVEVFGAKQPRQALAKVQQVRTRPSVAAWLADAPEPVTPGPTLEEARRQTRRAVVGVHGLMHGSGQVGGATLAEAGEPVLAGFAVNDQRKWEYDRQARLRLYGSNISLYFPLTTRWLLRRRDTTELAFYAELMARLDGWSSTMWDKVNDAYEKLVAEEADDIIAPELLRCERWMNECAAGTNDSDTMTFTIDVAHVLENFNHACLSPSLLAKQAGVTLRHTGDCRFVREAGSAAEVQMPSADPAAAADVGTAPCCTGQ